EIRPRAKGEGRIDETQHVIEIGAAAGIHPGEIHRQRAGLRNAQRPAFLGERHGGIFPVRRDLHPLARRRRTAQRRRQTESSGKAKPTRGAQKPAARHAAHRATRETGTEIGTNKVTDAPAAAWIRLFMRAPLSRFKPGPRVMRPQQPGHSLLVWTNFHVIHRLSSMRANTTSLRSVPAAATSSSLDGATRL